MGWTLGTGNSSALRFIIFPSLMSLGKTNKLPSGRQKTEDRTQKVSRAASNIRLQDEECLEISALISDCIACSDLTKCFVFVAEQSELKSTKGISCDCVQLSSWPNIKFDRDGAIILEPLKILELS